MSHRLRRSLIGSAAILLVTPCVAYADGAGGFDGAVTQGGGYDATGIVSVGAVQQVHQGSGPSETALYNGRPSEEELLAAANRAHQVSVLCDNTKTSMDAATKAKDTATAAAAQSYLDQNCKPGAAPGTFAPPAWVLGTEAVTHLKLPTAIPTIGPDPAANEWNMAVVGYPIWLSVEGSSAMNTSASVRGYTVTLAARRTDITFSMGDGGSVSCTTTTPYATAGSPGQESPDCGYRYQKASKPGQYRVVATSTWDITWSVLGESGTIPVTKVGGTSLTVGELEAVVAAANR